MPFIKDDEKAPLLDERLSAQNAKAKWIAIASVTPFLRLAASALTGVPLELTTSPVALAAVMGVIVQIEENGVNRILDDPPRGDYLTPTKAKSKRYVTSQLGTGDLALALDNAAVAVLRYTAYLEATVRADERAQGARSAGNDEAAVDREFEAGIFLERARAANVSKAEALIGLAIIWATFGSALTVGNQQLERQVVGSSTRDAAVRRTRLVVDRYMDRQIAASAREIQAAAEKDQVETSAEQLVLEAADGTQLLARDSLRFYADARSGLAPELVSRRQRQGLASGSVAEIESERASLEQGLAAWRSGDSVTARKLLVQASERIDIRSRIQRIPPLLENVRGPDLGELPPPRSGSDAEDE